MFNYRVLFYCRFTGTLTNPGSISKFGRQIIPFKPPITQQPSHNLTTFVAGYRSETAKIIPWWHNFNHPPVIRISCTCDGPICKGTCFIKVTQQIGHLTHNLPKPTILNNEHKLGIPLDGKEGIVGYKNESWIAIHFVEDIILTDQIQSCHSVLDKHTPGPFTNSEYKKIMGYLYNPKTGSLKPCPTWINTGFINSTPMDQEIFNK